jgi:hypothetical protein
LFNPQPVVSRVPIGPDGAVCTVIDDLLADPQALVDLAARHREAFAMAETNAFPGLEMPLPDSMVRAFGEPFSQHARGAIGARRLISGSGRLSMVTLPPAALSPLQRVCHRDRLATTADQCVGAAVLYLFRDARLGGTAFFRSRHDASATEALMHHWSCLDGASFAAQTGWPAAYMTGSNQHFEHLVSVPARFNRMICYDGSLFHCSDITQPALLGDDPARGRLTLNLFFICRRNAA